MNNFYCTQGFRNPAVLTFPDAASLLLWGDTQTVRELVDRHRSGDAEAKKLLPCLIIGRLRAAPVRKDENFEDAGIRLLDYDLECNLSRWLSTSLTRCARLALPRCSTTAIWRRVRRASST